MTTAVLALFAGAISVFGAYVGARTFAVNRDSARRSHELDRAGQIAERFTRAIDQLGHTHIDVRLGGIYALERIARDSKGDHPQVIEVLTAYVRECTSGHPHHLQAVITHPSDPKPPTEQAPIDDQTEPQPATDVQAAMSVLGRRDRSQDRPDAALDLARTDLAGLRLRGAEASLQHANLSGANLQHADLDGASLQHTNLRGANLQHASLRDANLGQADLVKASLQHADLSGANLKASGLVGANLQDAILFKANLHGANLEDTNLSGANLTAANVSHTKLEDANLSGAN